MVNLDMVGRCRDDYVYVGGTGTGKGFPDLVRKQAEKFPFKVEMGPGGTGPSDFESFYKKEVPVLAFFTGLHERVPHARGRRRRSSTSTTRPASCGSRTA